VGARRAGGAPARAGRRPLRPLGLRALEFARGEEGPLRPREELACELRGTVNLIVGAAVYERCRTLAQAAPLIRARGRLERREGAVNVSVAELAALEWRRVLWKSSPSRHK
jgi:hypothetical protein